MTDKRLEISTTPDAKRKLVTVQIAGKLDVFSFHELKSVFESLVKEEAALNLVVDLANVTFIASSGWSVLLARRKLSGITGGNLVICNLNEDIKRVYNSMRLREILPLAASVEEACDLAGTKTKGEA
jgi:anti-anti-sigma factor